MGLSASGVVCAGRVAVRAVQVREWALVGVVSPLLRPEFQPVIMSGHLVSAERVFLFAPGVALFFIIRVNIAVTYDEAAPQVRKPEKAALCRVLAAVVVHSTVKRCSYRSI